MTGSTNEFDDIEDHATSDAEQLRRRIDELERQIAQLQRSNEAKSTRMAALNHELKKPLNIINAYADIIGDPSYGDLTDKQKRFADNIKQAAEDLKQIIQDFLTIAKIDADSLGLNTQPIQTNQIVEQAIELTETASREFNSQVEFSPAGGNPLAVADERRLRQVLYNLLSNADNYSADGSTITVKVDDGEDAVRIEVADEGIGITPEDKERIFKEFQRTEQAKEQSDGAGLGLALSKRLVQMHGKDLHCDSAPGEGSTFWFTLPKFVADEEK